MCIVKLPHETRENNRLFAILFAGFCCFLCFASRFFPRRHQRFSLGRLALYHLSSPLGFPFVQAGFRLGDILARNCEHITASSLIGLAVLGHCDVVANANGVEICRHALNRLLATFTDCGHLCGVFAGHRFSFAWVWTHASIPYPDTVVRIKKPFTAHFY